MPSRRHGIAEARDAYRPDFGLWFAFSIHSAMKRAGIERANTVWFDIISGLPGSRITLLLAPTMATVDQSLHPFSRDGAPKFEMDAVGQLAFEIGG
jgi:hypothetical protein